MMKLSVEDHGPGTIEAMLDAGEFIVSEHRAHIDFAMRWAERNRRSYTLCRAFNPGSEPFWTFTPEPEAV